MPEGPNMIPDDWLRAINREFREQDIEPRRRPWLAIQRYSQEFGVSVDFSSPFANRIFEWFQSHTQPETHIIGPLFTGVFYFDACFWPVSIPHAYGTVSINALDSLESMPDTLKQEIMATPRDAWNYVLLWVDCLDYAYGFDDLHRSNTLDEFGRSLLNSGNGELNAAVSQICEFRPNPIAVMSSRMTVEMFLKSFIALKIGLTDREARRIGHNLATAIQRCIEIANRDDLSRISEELDVFPDVSERYSGAQRSSLEIWRAYSVAQYIATSFTREFTDRDNRDQFLPGDLSL